MNISETDRLISLYLKDLGTKTDALVGGKNDHISQILNLKDKRIIPYIKYTRLLESFSSENPDFFKKYTNQSFPHNLHNYKEKEQQPTYSRLKEFYVSPLYNLFRRSGEGEKIEENRTFEEAEPKIGVKQGKEVFIENARVVTSKLCKIVEERIVAQMIDEEYDPITFAEAVLVEIKVQNLPLSSAHLHMLLEGLVHIEKIYTQFSNIIGNLVGEDMSRLGYVELQSAENILNQHGEKNYFFWKQSGIDDIVLRSFRFLSHENKLVSFLQACLPKKDFSIFPNFEELLKNDSFDARDSEILILLEETLGLDEKNAFFETIAHDIYDNFKITVGVDINTSTPAIILYYDDPFGINDDEEQNNKNASQFLFLNSKNEERTSGIIEYEWQKFLQKNIFQEIQKKVEKNLWFHYPSNGNIHHLDRTELQKRGLFQKQDWEEFKIQMIASLKCENEFSLSSPDLYIEGKEGIKIHESVEKMAFICMLHSLKRIKTLLKPQWQTQGKKEEKNMAAHELEEFDFLEGLPGIIQSSESIEIARKRIDIRYGDIYEIFDSEDFLEILKYIQNYEKEMEFINIADLSIWRHADIGVIEVVNNFTENTLRLDQKIGSAELLKKIQTIV